jgi:opacity protein-like surface antigen
MKRLLIVSLLGLGWVCTVRAQEAKAADTAAARLTLSEPLDATGFATSTASSTTGFSTAFATPAPAAAPAPEPKFLYGGRDDYRWQLGVGATYIRFHSSIFNANAVGIKTSLTYFTNNWFAIEGNLSTAFASEVFAREHVKLIDYGAGPKIAWRQKRWEPWAHGIFGGAHEQPQVAGSSKNTYSIQAGGGVDYRYNPRVSLRLEGNYVRTGFFHQSQNDFEVAGGIVFHF